MNVNGTVEVEAFGDLTIDWLGGKFNYTRRHLARHHQEKDPIRKTIFLCATIKRIWTYALIDAHIYTYTDRHPLNCSIGPLY